jgi:hypothetical protein
MLKKLFEALTGEGCMKFRESAMRAVNFLCGLTTPSLLRQDM